MGAWSTQVVDAKMINKHLDDVLMGDGASSLTIHAVKQEVGRRVGVDFGQKKQACSYFHKRLQKRLLQHEFEGAVKPKKKRVQGTKRPSKVKVDFGRMWWQYEVRAMWAADTWQHKHDIR